MPARRQNSMTKGVEINFGGAREVYLREFKSVDQTKKVKTLKKKGLQFKNFHKLWFPAQNFAIFHES